jgi:hypothetical protein
MDWSDNAKHWQSTAPSQTSYKQAYLIERLRRPNKTLHFTADFQYRQVTN